MKQSVESSNTQPSPSPAASPSQSEHEEPLWRVVGVSVRGASHARTHRPNQDAIAWQEVGEAVVLALADGHGSPRYIRSHQGAKLAVQTAVAELEKFYLEHGTSATLKRHADEQLPRTLVRSWQDAVSRKIDQRPLTEAELADLERRLPDATPAEFLESRPQRIFGATLLAGIITPAFGLFLQLGDGDIVIVDTKGTAARIPLATDTRLIANQTTSLAGAQAWQDMRVYFQPFIQSPPALMLFATDGYANSFQDDAGFLTAAADFHNLVQAQGPDYVRRGLPGWLAQTSQLGSGDDITVGIVSRR